MMCVCGDQMIQNPLTLEWVCESCGERATCNTPNVFFTEGLTHEDCGHTTYPTKFGLMVMKMMKNG